VRRRDGDELGVRERRNVHRAGDEKKDIVTDTDFARNRVSGSN
jgi:hypothetical protein